MRHLHRLVLFMVAHVAYIDFHFQISPERKGILRMWCACRVLWDNTGWVLLSAGFFRLCFRSSGLASRVPRCACDPMPRALMACRCFALAAACGDRRRLVVIGSDLICWMGIVGVSDCLFFWFFRRSIATALGMSRRTS